MKKQVIIINGRGGVGKDTLCDAAAGRYKVRNVSSITPIKEIAKQCGWNGEKTPEARRFLSDLKRLCTDYNELPTRYLKDEYKAFLKSDEELMFVHIREGSEIDKFKRAIDGNCLTLLIYRSTDRDEEFGNVSDDNVADYTYDCCFDNSAPLEEAGEQFRSYLNEIL